MGFAAAEAGDVETRRCCGAGSGATAARYLATAKRYLAPAANGESVFGLGDCTPPRQRFVENLLDVCRYKTPLRTRKRAIAPLPWAMHGRRTRTIRKNVIGHDMPVFGARVGRRFHLARRQSFGVLHQPAGEHRSGILLEPAIEQLGDLLPKICGMAQAREFVALQRVARGREQELPGRLGFVMGQRGLQGKQAHRGDRTHHGAARLSGLAHVNRQVILVTRDGEAPDCGKLWKFSAWDSDQASAATHGEVAP
jgi:hypothetical protein